jgi:hypothetical protein
MSGRKFGVSAKEREDLRERLPQRDDTAEKLGLSVYQDSIETAEDKIPWLKARRQLRRRR